MVVLHEFIEKWVLCNTLVRLWKPITPEKPYAEKIMLTERSIMSWEAEQVPYLREAEVIGLTDIFGEPDPEAVNIVVNTGLEPDEVVKLVCEWRAKREAERRGCCDG